MCKQQRAWHQQLQFQHVSKQVQRSFEECAPIGNSSYRSSNNSQLSWKRTGKTASQKLDVRSLIAGNGLDVVVDNRVEAGSLEVALGELLKTLAVEGVLEVLQRQGVLEDVSCTQQLASDSIEIGRVRANQQNNEPSVTAARLATVAGAAETSPAATTAAIVAWEKYMLEFDVCMCVCV